jgi:hypothetical protein
MGEKIGVASKGCKGLLKFKIGKKVVTNVLLDGGFKVNIITKDLKKRLRLP